VKLNRNTRKSFPDAAVMSSTKITVSEVNSLASRVALVLSHESFDVDNERYYRLQPSRDEQ